MSESHPQATDIEETLPQDAEAAERSARLSRRRLAPPGDVPGYKIEYCLGEGAYGSVWLAREHNTGKQVAIKFYTHRGGLDWSVLNREVEKLAMLYTSRDIVRLNEVGWDADPPYYVMEYLENGSLEALLKEGPISPAETVRVAEAVLRALVHAHGSGILHCDIKPANVLLDGDMQPRVADFGQSRLSNEQDPALGTLFYMAPEQADLAAVPDARWDVYALGALLYHCLCGKPPFRDEATERRILEAESLRERLSIYRRALKSSEKPQEHRKQPGVDKRLAQIIDQCLEINPKQRFPNAQAVFDALKSRARQRARRPAIVMGIIAPLLLLAMLVPLGYRAADLAVVTSEEAVVFRALENNKLTAKATARMLESELLIRKSQLLTAAANPELADAIEQERDLPREERTELIRLVKDYHRRYGVVSQLDRPATASAENLETNLDRSWFVNDISGKQLWRDPFSDRTIDGYYYWRDYYHWQGKTIWDGVDPALEPAFEDIQPAWSGHDFHITAPFISQETYSYMVAMSVLVQRKGQEKPVGLLTRTIDVGRLLSSKNLGGTRSVAMVDSRTGEYLDHPRMISEELATLSGAEVKELFKTFKLSPETLEKLKQATSENQPGIELDTVVETDHYDPIEPDKERWLATFVRIPGTQWWAIAQERYADAVKPVQEVQADLTKYGLIGLLIFFALIGTLWFFLLRGVSNRTVRIGSSTPNLSDSGATENITGTGRDSSVA